MLATEEILNDLAACCRLAYTQKLVSGSGGNLSARIGDDIYITPTGCRLGDVYPDTFVRVSLDGGYEGDNKPSKELNLHIKTYITRPDISAVVHLHPSYCIIVGILDVSGGELDAMPAYTAGFSAKIGSVKTAPFCEPGSDELAGSVAEKIRKSDVVFLKNHGILAVGKTPKIAFSNAEETEDNARLHFLLSGKGAL